MPSAPDASRGSATSAERVVWPRGRSRVVRATLARRLSSLAGRRVGFLWDHVFRGDEVFPILQEELGRRFPGTTFVPYTAFGATFGGDEARTVGALAANLGTHGVDAIVSGMGC